MSYQGEQETVQDVLAVLKRPEGEIRLLRKEFRGKVYADLRYFWQKEEMGDPIPTKKGVTLSLSELAELLPLLGDLAGEAPAPDDE